MEEKKTEKGGWLKKHNQRGVVESEGKEEGKRLMKKQNKRSELENNKKNNDEHKDEENWKKQAGKESLFLSL